MKYLKVIAQVFVAGVLGLLIFSNAFFGIALFIIGYLIMWDNANNRKQEFIKQNASLIASEDLLNEGIDFFKELRLSSDPNKIRNLLICIIDKSLKSISYDLLNGDAYVLLANAYILSDIYFIDYKKRFFESLKNITPEKEEIESNYLNKLAGGVIYHWYSSTLRQPQYTDNITNGLNIYNSAIRNVTTRANGDCDPDLVLKEYCETYLSEALSNSILEKFKTEAKS